MAVKQLFVCEDRGLAAALNTRLGDNVALGFGDMGEGGKCPPAAVAAVQLHAARAKGIEPVVVLHSTNFIAWAIKLRAALRGEVGILAPFQFEVTKARNQWAPFKGDGVMAAFNEWHVLPLDKATPQPKKEEGHGVLAGILKRLGGKPDKPPVRTYPEVSEFKQDDLIRTLDELAEGGAMSDTGNPEHSEADALTHAHYNRLAQERQADLALARTMAGTLLRKKRLLPDEKVAALQLVEVLKDEHFDIAEQLRLRAEK